MSINTTLGVIKNFRSDRRHGSILIKVNVPGAEGAVFVTVSKRAAREYVEDVGFTTKYTKVVHATNGENGSLYLDVTDY